MLLPKIDADTIRDTLASYAAAADTINQRPEPQTDEGRQAKQGMQSRVQEGERRLTTLFGTVVAKARVFQGGGNELTTSSLRDGVEAAGRHALSRQFPKFGIGDNAELGQGQGQGPRRRSRRTHLAWAGPARSPPTPSARKSSHEPLVPARRAATSNASSATPRTAGRRTPSTERCSRCLRTATSEPNATASPSAGAKELPATQIGKATFYKEDEPPSTSERMAVRGVLTEAKVPYTTGQEGAAISGLLQHLADLAARCRRPSAAPEPPDTTHLEGLEALAGNQQFRAVAESRRTAPPGHRDLDRSQREAEQTARPRGRSSTGCSTTPAALDATAEVREQRDAILASRLLLADPDPVTPLIDELCTALRSALTDALDDVAVGATTSRSRSSQSSDGWDQLDADQQQAVLRSAGLGHT